MCIQTKVEQRASFKCCYNLILFNNYSEKRSHNMKDEVIWAFWGEQNNQTVRFLLKQLNFF